MIQLTDITVQIGDATLVKGSRPASGRGSSPPSSDRTGRGRRRSCAWRAVSLRRVAGTVQMDGQTLDALPPRDQARRRAVLPQQSHLPFAFSVLEVVLMGRTPHLQGAESTRDWQIAEAALETVGMGAFATRAFPTLSGGEQQRVHLARALAQIWTPPANGHRYLLLDEPTASLDLAHQHQVLQTADALAAEGVGVLAILHDLNLAAQYADHVVIMKRGRGYTQGAPEAVFTPEGIHDVFGWPVCILDHPTQSCPLIVAEAGPSSPVGTPGAAQSFDQQSTDYADANP